MPDALIDALANCKGLCAISICPSTPDIDDDGFETVPNVKLHQFLQQKCWIRYLSVSSLVLSGSNVVEASIFDLDSETASALHLPAVQSMILCNPDWRGIARLAPLPKLTSLQLRFEDSDFEDSGENVELTIREVEQHSRAFPALLELACSSDVSFPHGFEDYPRDSLLHNLSLPSLTSLKLEDAIPELNMPNLQKLDIWRASRHHEDLVPCFISAPSLISLRAHAEGCFLESKAFSGAVETGWQNSV